MQKADFYDRAKDGQYENETLKEIVADEFNFKNTIMYQFDHISTAKDNGKEVEELIRLRRIDNCAN